MKKKLLLFVGLFLLTILLAVSSSAYDDTLLGEDLEDGSGYDEPEFQQYHTGELANGDISWITDLNAGLLEFYGTGVIEWGNPDYDIAPWLDYPYAVVYDIVIYDGIEGIGDYAFYQQDFYSITIPESVTSIGNYAFYNVSASIQLPDSITSIGDYAFAYSGVSATVSENVESIGQGAFIGVEGIIVDEENEFYSSIDGVLFNKNKTELLQYTWGSGATFYEVPESVTSIAAEAFAGSYYGVSDLLLHSGVQTIGANAFVSYESVLETIYYTGSESEFANIDIDEGNEAFLNAKVVYNVKAASNCGDKLTWFIDNNNKLTVRGSGKMENYTSTYSAPWAEYAEEITTVEIGSGITSIGDYAFNGCTAISEITLPGSVAVVGNGAFNECDNLENISYSGTEEDWNGISIGENNGKFTTVEIDTTTFETESDAGFYAESFNAEEKTGVILLNTCLETALKYSESTVKFGIYIYNTTTNKKVSVESGELGALAAADGWFSVLVTNIAKEHFGKNIMTVPFVVIDTDGDTATTDDQELITGNSMLVSVAQDSKWLGKNNPYAK